MLVHFLLGPAGSGKTWRCLGEIRAELKRAPEGSPLLLLAPKQATFQLERQLLDDPEQPPLAGYTRLQIVSFDRLAHWLLETFSTVPELIDDEGRVMVLRALLAREQPALRVFRATARLPGFARQLSQLLREFQRHQITPARLARLAERCTEHGSLRDKLHDLHHLLRAYHEWLAGSDAQDGDRLLDLATDMVREPTFVPRQASAPIAGLWLDGFAEMTPQEVDLLCAVLPFCRTATLAFCLDTQASDSQSWLSLWSTVRRTYGDFRQRVEALRECEVVIEALPRTPARSRFGESPQLAQLEANWTEPSTTSPVGRDSVEAHSEQSQASGTGISPAADVGDARCARADSVGKQGSTESHPTGPIRQRSAPHPASSIQHPASPLRLVQCANPEAEAAFAARQILRHVHAGGRFRECAVILRSVDQHHAALRRTFTRHGIPFFLDRREPVAHHPLAELTRFALRTLAYGWLPEDWFGVLKTGLVHGRDGDIDWLENVALAHGWRGAQWLEPLAIPEPKFNLTRAEELRRRFTAPFLKLAEQLNAASGPSAASPSPPPGERAGVRGPSAPSTSDFQGSVSTVHAGSETGAPQSPSGQRSAAIHGFQLAAALRALWDALGIEACLQAWDDALAEESDSPNLAPPLHATVLRQMNTWLENLERAFPATTVALPLREWLPIVEAGLSTLSVGVIPPALDQVLIGTVDRSRNPELELALVLGLNEGSFPAPPAPPVLLSDSERDLLALHDLRLGLDPRAQIAHERYFGYIACTRSRARLILSCSAASADGKPLHPSPLLAHVQSRFPGLELETIVTAMDWREAEHTEDVLEPLLRELATASSTAGEGEQATLSQGTAQSSAPHPASSIQHPASLRSLASLPAIVPVIARWRELLASHAAASLSPDAVARLYGRELTTSVSKLEQFSECPFKFFVAAGLEAEERKEFEIDHRERGSYLHRLLDEFHLRVVTSGRRWRDLTPAAASELAAQVGEDLLASPEFALFAADDARRFAARSLIASAQRLLGALVGWMPGYRFDPVAVELGFGLPGGPLPAWRLDLDDGRALLLRGRIDRVDLCRDEKTGETLAVVVDYKSSPKKLEKLKVEHGLQLQLLAYLNVLRAHGGAGLPSVAASQSGERAGVRGEGVHTPASFGPLLVVAPPHPQSLSPGGGERGSRLDIGSVSVSAIHPAGVFYVPLHGAAGASGSRAEILAEDEAARRATYQHAGRFDFSHRALFDSRVEGHSSGQFRYRLNKDGGLIAHGSDGLAGDDFNALLSQVEANLRGLGEAIFAGRVEVAPVRLSASEKACDRCDYRAICRFDPWTQPYRSLRSPTGATGPEA